MNMKSRSEHFKLSHVYTINVLTSNYQKHLCKEYLNYTSRPNLARKYEEKGTPSLHISVGKYFAQTVFHLKPPLAIRQPDSTANVATTLRKRGYVDSPGCHRCSKGTVVYVTVCALNYQSRVTSLTPLLQSFRLDF